MSEQSSVSEGEARAAEIRRDVEAAEARRAEEEAAEAEQEIIEAREEKEKLSRRARRKREKAEKAAQDAQAAREQADTAQAEAERRSDEAVSSVSGASVTSPGIGGSTPPHAAAAANAPGSRPASGVDTSSETPLTERPEVLIGAAFAGSFILARVLKRLVD